MLYNRKSTQTVVAPDKLLSTCHSIARDIVSCPQDMIRKNKKLIDDGFHVTWVKALSLKERRIMSTSKRYRREKLLSAGTASWKETETRPEIL